MKATDEHQCCPPFDPDGWDGKELAWENKRFVTDRVRSFLHIPLNFGGVMKRNVALIDAANAGTNTRLVLADENSLWGADVYIEVDRDVPGANMAAISGTFLCKVFEGPYSDMRKWMVEMPRFVESKGRRLKRMLFYYTTCPKCAKKTGRNYVVLLAEV
jgi:hypothetical protein